MIPLRRTRSIATSQGPINPSDLRLALVEAHAALQRYDRNVASSLVAHKDIDTEGIWAQLKYLDASEGGEVGKVKKSVTMQVDDDDDVAEPEMEDMSDEAAQPQKKSSLKKDTKKPKSQQALQLENETEELIRKHGSKGPKPKRQRDYYAFGHGVEDDEEDEENGEEQEGEEGEEGD
eukprot:PhF_6_TR40387/c0_g1_i3/m.60165